MLTITVLPNDGSMPYERRFRNPKNAAKFLESLSGRRPTKRAADATKPCANFQKAHDGKCYNCGFGVKAHR